MTGPKSPESPRESSLSRAFIVSGASLAAFFVPARNVTFIDGVVVEPVLPELVCAKPLARKGPWTMHFKPSLLIIAALAGLLAADRFALAVDPNPGTYRSKTSGDWNDSATWQVFTGLIWQNATGYPQAGDAATIRQHTVALTQDEGVDFLTIEHHGVASVGSHALTVAGHNSFLNGLQLQTTIGQRGGKVVVGSDGKLELTGGGTVGLDGQILLEACALLSFEGTDPYTLAGIGRVTGDDCTARIHLADDMKVFNQALIEGAMKIEADPSNATATLVNMQFLPTLGGIIRADREGTLELASNLFLEDTVLIVGLDILRPRYEALGSPKARLRFSHPSDGISGLILQGNFEIDHCAAMEFLADVQTSGSLAFNAGTIFVASGRSFIWDSGSYGAGTHTIGDCDVPDELDCDCRE